jgi:hypothetical protein
VLQERDAHIVGYYAPVAEGEDGTVLGVWTGESSITRRPSTARAPHLAALDPSVTPTGRISARGGGRETRASAWRTTASRPHGGSP